MSQLNFAIDVYRMLVPKFIRKRIAPRIKRHLKKRVGFGTSENLGFSNTKYALAPESDILELLQLNASQQKKRMLMIVGNIIAVDSRVLKSANAMYQAGFHVVLIGMKPLIGEAKLTSFGSIPAVLLDSSELKASNDPEALSASIASQLVPIIKAYNPTNVYSHDFFGLAFISECIDILNQKQYCHWTHDIHEHLPGLEGAIDPERLAWAKKIEENRLSIPDNIIIVNEQILDLMKHMFSPHQRIDVLHNVPRTGEASKFNLRSACKIAADKPLAVYTGSAKKLRGLNVIIPALSEMPELNVALLSQGARPYLDELRARAEQIGASSRLHIFPYVPDPQVSDAIKSADFGIAPFTKYGNTELALATKLFEYIHAGLPVIGSDCMVMENFINEHGCGEVFKSESAEGFVQAIRKVLSKPKSRYSVSKKKLQEFSWDEQIKPLVKYIKTTDKFDKSGRIFHGPGPSAGQPRIISAEMQSNGVEAYSVSIVSDTTFDYGKDIFFPYRDGIRDPKSLLNWASKRFGIFHFYFRTTSNYVMNGEVSDEVYQDIHTLRSLGAKTIMHFRGSEVRVQSLFKKCNRFAWGDEEDHFPGGDIFRTKILNTSRGLFDKLLVTDAELQSYVDKSEVLERAVDFEKIDAALTVAKADTSRTENKTIRIAHAPSRRALKGTQIVLETVQSLMDEGINLEIDIIENVTNEDALVRLASADLVIDQMRIGWYGVLTVEAMALGKPTVAYIRDDLVEKLEKECPILITNPDQLKHDLSEWVKNSSKLKEVGKASRRFAKKYHCSKVVAKKALKIYETL